jgi:hypothetical protein
MKKPSKEPGRGAISRLVGCLPGIFGASAPAAPAPINLADPSSYHALMDRMLRLTTGARFEGVRQTNNYVFMCDWVYRRGIGTQSGQHILIFFNGRTEKAVAWVEPGGAPVQVPGLPPGVDPSLDRAIDLDGEEFKGTEITADGKIYMFRFIEPEW